MLLDISMLQAHVKAEKFEMLNISKAELNLHEAYKKGLVDNFFAAVNSESFHVCQKIVLRYFIVLFSTTLISSFV